MLHTWNQYDGACQLHFDKKIDKFKKALEFIKKRKDILTS